jgi:hypothetical protein
MTIPVPMLPPRHPGSRLEIHLGEVPPEISYAVTTDSLALPSPVAFRRRGFRSVALTANAVCCS